MQLRKLNWKRIRGMSPCLSCGDSHETKCCINRNGKKKIKLGEVEFLTFAPLPIPVVE